MFLFTLRQIWLALLLRNKNSEYLVNINLIEIFLSRNFLEKQKFEVSFLNNHLTKFNIHCTVILLNAFNQISGKYLYVKQSEVLRMVWDTT